MTVPDVSVVIAVRDAPPRLADSLASLAGQTLGAGRLEVVAVAHGPAGGGAELARLASLHPGLLRVAPPPPGAGGPAGAADHGTALAAGRYVLRLPAGDRLGAEALERLVATADRLGSDVVLPLPVGPDGRARRHGIFAAPADRVSRTDPALPWALSETMLVRRELITGHGLRRRPDLPVHAEQVFAVAALLHARRISVTTDYGYLLPAHRTVPRAEPGEVLRGVRAVQEVVERLTGPGPERDAIHGRYFGWELPQLLQPPFLALDGPEQLAVLAETGRLVDRYCSPALFVRLPVADRLRLALARRGELAALRGLIAHEAVHGPPPEVRRGGRSYAGYPAFRDPALGLPDALFELPGGPAVRPPGWRRLVPRQVRREARRWRRAWRDARPAKAAGS
ncbi:glycosyltransferase [Kitasatospora sp. NPDC048540]|uniref:glycosyltransferase n=1 Tax=Kitasatospora sp. NPDC048540 TaxID=3155634 RepID=UPI0033F9CE94